MEQHASDEMPDWPRLEGSYIEGHWRGEHSLPRSFWLNYVVVAVVVGVASVVLLFTFFSSVLAEDAVSHDFAAFFFIFTFVGSILGVWQLVGLWRSAANCKLHTGQNGWATVVQILVVLGWIGFVLNWIQAFSML